MKTILRLIAALTFSATFQVAHSQGFIESSDQTGNRWNPNATTGMGQSEYVGSESPFSTYLAESGRPIENEMVIDQNLTWLGIAPPNAAVTATVREDKSIVVSGPGFTVVLAPDGQFVSRQTPHFDAVRVPNDLAPYRTDQRPIALVKLLGDDAFEFTDSGAPLPKGGLVGEARKMQTACISASQDLVEEARIMELATGPDAYLFHGEIAAHLQQKGVDTSDMEGAVNAFIRQAHSKKKKMEAKYERKWQRLIRDGGGVMKPREKGPAERMGEAAGPAVGAAGLAAGAIYGPAVAAPWIAIGGAGATQTETYSKVTRAVGGGYGRIVDETQVNPFYAAPMRPPSGERKSMVEILRELMKRVSEE